MKQCDWCHRYFDPAVSFQIYCSEECRTAATKHNQEIKSKERKLNRRKNKIRICANSDCDNVLSIYNDSKYCASCFFSEHVVLRELNNIKRRTDAKDN